VKKRRRNSAKNFNVKKGTEILRKKFSVERRRENFAKKIQRKKTTQKILQKIST
jgi:hypothetical protein